MKIEIVGTNTVLKPDDGCKYITNGETWSTEVWLGTLDAIANWHDTNTEPPTPVDPETQELADVVNDAYEMANDLI